MCLQPAINAQRWKSSLIQSTNTRTFGDNEHITAPEVYWDYCGPHLICMERMSGVPMDQFQVIQDMGVDGELILIHLGRGNYFSLDPDHANVLAPRKRTLHTLLPGMLFRDGTPDPWIVVGSMGGDAQPQIHAQFVSAVVDGGLDIATAISALAPGTGLTRMPAARNGGQKLRRRRMPPAPNSKRDRKPWDIFP